MAEPTDAKPSRWRQAVPIAAVALCLAVSACYWFQPDWLAGLTLVPAWCWLIPALALVCLGYCRKLRRWSIAVFVVWLIFAGVFVQELRSLVRFGGVPTATWIAAYEQGRAIRVVSLNCRVGNVEAAAEVAAYEPDIVLLQESPNREAVEALARELFGEEAGVLWGYDTSILTRGRLTPRSKAPFSHFAHAVVTLPNGLEAEVVSLRLSPPVARLDFWSPGFWRAHRDNRARHRTQIEEVMSAINKSQPARIIVGGDFNAPAGDGALAAMKPLLFDTFGRAGRGWGNTGTNEFPLFRVDQIWASEGFRTESVTAHRTVHSDHRLVVCDLLVKEGESPVE